MSVDGHEPDRSLVRGLSMMAGAAVIIAQVIGTGVFLKARVMICNVGTPGLVLTAWAVAGLMCLAGALTYAELGAMMPRSGGEYHFLNAAYGRIWAFLYGWIQSLIGKAGAQAALAAAFVIFLGDLLGGRLPLLAVRLLPIVVIATATLLNLASIGVSGRLASGLTAVKIALVIGVGIAAFLFGDGSWSHYADSAAAVRCDDVGAGARFGVAGFGAAMLGALWGYNGWTNLTQVGGELKEPERNLPKALIGGVLGIIALYLFANTAYFYALTPSAVANVPGSSSVAREVAVRALGAGVAGVIAAGLMASSFGSLFVTTMTGARITYALSRDALLPSALGAISSISRVPWLAILAQGTWASVLALSGSFDTLSDYSMFGTLILEAMAVGAVFVLRRTRPDAPRPCRTWGYPVVPIVSVAGSLLMIVSTLVATPGRALAGLGLIACGLPVYAYYSHRAAPAAASDWAATESVARSG
jgi:basic amino acid/polyamine antiporter, APA family